MFTYLVDRIFLLGIALAQSGNDNHESAGLDIQPNDGRGVTLENPIGCDSFLACGDKIIDGLIQISIPIVVIVVLVGGFQLMTAGGDPEKIKTGKKTITYAAVGFLVVLLAKSFVLIIQNTFK